MLSQLSPSDLAQQCRKGYYHIESIIPAIIYLIATLFVRKNHCKMFHKVIENFFGQSVTTVPFLSCAEESHVTPRKLFSVLSSKIRACRFAAFLLKWDPLHVFSKMFCEKFSSKFFEQIILRTTSEHLWVTGLKNLMTRKFRYLGIKH